MKLSKMAKMKELPIRICYSMHDCCLCKEAIQWGERYHDGGVRNRAHVECVGHESGGGRVLVAQ